MKENEFDIYVRKALQDAEETVSPGVWEGIAAALDKPRRVFPLWGWWSVSGVAAVAAAVALFLFLKPAPVGPDPAGTILAASPLAQATIPEEILAPVTKVAEPAAPQQSSRRSIVQPAVRPAPVVEAVASAPELVSLVQQPAREKLAAIPANTTLHQGVDDAVLLARLAYSETRRPEEKRVSTTVSGNLQATQRRGVNPVFSRPYAASPYLSPMEESVTEGPETRFGLPFSAGLGIRFHLNSRWSIGTGIRYTFLSRTFPGIYQGNGIRTDNPPATIDNNQHWLGIPLNLYYSFISQGRWRVHAFLGGAGEYLVDNHYLIQYSPKDIHYHQNGKAPIQWSVAAGMGAEFKITPVVGIYLDPSVRYYIRTDLQPARSLRTIHPLMFDAEMGIRFSF